MPEPIFAEGPVDTPFVYTISGTGTVTPRACAALFDGTNASGDFLPGVVLRSQAGHVIARATDQGVKVTAGNSAEVSFFPGVNKASAAASAASLDSALYETNSSGTTYNAGTHNITFTALHTNAPSVFSIDGGDPTIYTISADGLYMAWGEFHLTAQLAITSNQILEATNPVAVNADGTFDEILADATHPIEFGNLRGVTFLNVNGAPKSGRFKLTAGQNLGVSNGSGLSIIRLTTAHL